ncbi:hypothetical protein GCM10010330_79160 [Streptomyces tendae]|uniref:hypothetical protein n=1 Tax=Streptomyces tendae TaxID=1932 RepID=UPI00167768E0|nr:hypothetical protein [Streptomyces tendae]GHB13414.1 hypothetical protein GCM10010330_79160 [Streptomyces tendae]
MALNLRIAGLWPAMTAAGLLALSGCSQGGGDVAAPAASGGGKPSPTASAGGELTIPSDVDEETKKQYVQENAMAACMRAKGFTYTPHVVTYDDALSPVDGEDYDAAKKYREKYGFGLYAGAVYRDDPNVFGSAASNKVHEDNPDSAYLDSLTPAQKAAYEKARGEKLRNGKHELGPGCLRDAREKAYGPEKSQAEVERETAEESQRALAAQQALNGDPQLVSLAQEFAGCLTKAGIPVTTTQPTSIGDMVKFQVGDTTPVDGILSLDEDEALARLTHEIGLAKKDLECGKKFRAAYFPKHAKHPFESVTG